MAMKSTKSSQETTKQMLERYRNGSLRVRVVYTNSKTHPDFFGEGWKVKSDDALISNLGEWLEHVERPGRP